MTAAALNMPVPRPSARAPEVATRSWGFDPRALHDHFWALHGVRVVRRGSGRFGSKVVASFFSFCARKKK